MVESRVALSPAVAALSPDAREAIGLLRRHVRHLGQFAEVAGTPALQAHHAAAAAELLDKGFVEAYDALAGFYALTPAGIEAQKELFPPLCWKPTPENPLDKSYWYAERGEFWVCVLQEGDHWLYEVYDAGTALAQGTSPHAHVEAAQQFAGALLARWYR